VCSCVQPANTNYAVQSGWCAVLVHWCIVAQMHSCMLDVCTTCAATAVDLVLACRDASVRAAAVELIIQLPESLLGMLDETGAASPNLCEKAAP
jgi:hypothetical protein